jgi:transmembrane sensor
VLIHSGKSPKYNYSNLSNGSLKSKEHALAISQIERFTQGLSGLPSSFQPDALVESKQKFNTSLKHNMLFWAFRLFSPWFKCI